MVSAGTHDGGFDYVGSDRAFRQAFIEAGLMIDELTVEQVAKQLGSPSHMAVQFAISLTEWARFRRLVEDDSDPSTFEHLLAVADAIDPDPWRRQLRAILRKKEGTRGTELAVLAASVRSTDISPTTLAMLAAQLKSEVSPEAALELLRPALVQHPDDFWLSFRIAACFGAAHPPQLEEQTAYFRVAQAIRPESAAARNNLGFSLREQGKLDEAIAVLQSAIQLDPEYAMPHSNMGAVLKDQGKLDQALRICLSAVELDPKLALAHANLGDVLREKGKLDDAIACYRLAIQLDPNFASAHNNLGNLLWKQGKLNEAIAVLQSAIDLDPNLAAAHSNLGNVLVEQGRLDDAIACYRLAIDLNPKYKEAHGNLGNALKKQGKLEQASEHYRTVIRLDPMSAAAHNNLATVLVDQGKPEEAIAYYETAIQLDPQFAMAHNNLGSRLREQGKLDEASEYFRKAIQLDPNYVNAHNNLGRVFMEQGKLDEAIEFYRTAIQLDPNYVYAYNNLGTALKQQGKLDEAIEFYRAAIRLDPKFAQAYGGLGYILAVQDRLDEAVDCWRTAIELNPKDIRILINLGLALKTQGKLKEAIACYRRAIDLDPNQASYHKSVAKLLSQSGDEAGSCAAYREVIRIRPNDSATLNTLAWVLATDTDPELRNAAEAVKLAGRAVELAPKEWAYWDTLAVAAHASENWSESLRARETMLTLKPGQVVDLFYLAIANENLGHHDSALDCYFPATAQARSKIELTLRDEFEQLLGLNANDRHELVSTHYADPPPKNADAKYWISRGAWNMQLNKWDRAAEAYSKVLALEPEASKYWDPYTKSLVFSGQLTEYRAFCKKLLDQYGETDDSQVARSITGRLLISPDAVGDWSKPLKLAELLLSQDGTKAHVSEIYCRAGKYQQSLDLRAEAIAEAGREANGWDCFWQGMAHRGLGDHERAFEFASKARQLADSGRLGAKNLKVFNLMYMELRGALDASAKEGDE